MNNLIKITKTRPSSALLLIPQKLHQNTLVRSKTTNLVLPSNLTKSPPSDRRESDDVVSLNRSITSYVRSGDLGSALKVFQGMKIKTTVTWNSILSGYAKIPGKLKEARQLFDEIPQPDSVSYNTMLVCYLKNSGAESATEFFAKIPVKDTVTWNTMISGLARERKMKRAHQLFVQMPGRNGVSWSAMISGYIDSGDLRSAEELFESAPEKSVVAWTAMINGHMKAGDIESAERLFFSAAVEKNVVTWNAMIAGYVENRVAENGLRLFKAMIVAGVRPNSSTIATVLLGCSDLSGLRTGRQVHQTVQKSPMINDTTVGTSILSMYSKCGALEEARRFFHLDLPRRDVVAWNAMITGYALHGAGREALEVFYEMRNKEFRPDRVTLWAVLLACNHAGLVEDGLRHFGSMETEHRLEPGLEHYLCIVDLFGRAGRLHEAVDVIEKIPFGPHPAVFGTLLTACRTHKNAELARYAAESLLSLDPSSSAAYVQLANAYAAAGDWGKVVGVRRAMRDNKVAKKIPGRSWIEVEGSVHVFRSSDIDHLEIESIHCKLSELNEKMRSRGYVPDLESALWDVGSDQKERLLLWHSEKLAIAYGLMKVKAEGIPIRVFKNLRICSDCHQAAGFVSAIERREIIVRDAVRFHHFKAGSCSCGGYW